MYSEFTDRSESIPITNQKVRITHILLLWCGPSWRLLYQYRMLWWCDIGTRVPVSSAATAAAPVPSVLSGAKIGRYWVAKDQNSGCGSWVSSLDSTREHLARELRLRKEAKSWRWSWLGSRSQPLASGSGWDTQGQLVAATLSLVSTGTKLKPYYWGWGLGEAELQLREEKFYSQFNQLAD